MKNKILLNCTFRDVGYYNKWNFNFNQLNPESIIISGMASIIIDSIYANTKSIYVDTGFYLSFNLVLDKLKKINNNYYSSTLDDLSFKIKNLKEKKNYFV